MRSVPRERVLLIHWNAAEARERIERLRAAGFEAKALERMKPELLRSIGDEPPAAIVIDLTRLPTHGREVAIALRHRKSTRAIPLVLVEGDPEKVKRIREFLPDAVYASWRGVRGALRRAIDRPVAEPRVPRSVLEAYSATPLPRKLGIRPGATVAVLGAPPEIEETLGELPPGATLRKGARGRFDLMLYFARSRSELRKRIEPLASGLDPAGLWILWPKKASGMASDLGERDVREAGLAAGLVDYKVCAFDATWSGLKFSVRKTPPAR